MFKPTDLTLKGKAKTIDSGPETGWLQLTPSQPFASGSAFYTEGLDISQNRSFSTYFSMKMTNAVKGGADGIMFVLSSRPYDIGRDGGGIGYLGVKDSIGIEFDTFNNHSLYADPDGNHIAVNLNGDLSKPITTTKSGSLQSSGIILDDGNSKHVWLEFDGNSQTLHIRISNNKIRPTNATLTVNSLNLTKVLTQPTIYLGFTSATGDSYSSHFIERWYFDKHFHETGISLSEVKSTQDQEPLPSNQTPIVPSKTWQNNQATRNIEGNILGTDADQDPLQYRIIENPKNGTLTFDAKSGSFNYSPNEKFVGNDSFKVIANDGKVDSKSAEQTLVVNPENVLPTVQAQQYSTKFNETISSKIIAQDLNLDKLTYQLTNTPTKGNIALNEQTGNFVYTPNPGETGTDEFQMIVNDGFGNSQPATITVTIQPMNILPKSSSEQAQSGITLEKSFQYDPVDAKLTKDAFVVIKPPQFGAVTWSDQGIYKYTSELGYVGTDRFTFAIFNGEKLSEPAEVVINVAPQKKVSYMYGYIDRQFKPQRPISRAELAATIVRLTGIKVDDQPSIVFKDVHSKNWMHRDVSIVHTHRIMNADAKMIFVPQRSVNRSEFNTIMNRLLQKNLITQNALRRAQKEVLWLGDSQLKAKKQDKIELSRLEAVIIFNRLFNRVTIPYPESFKSPWSDVNVSHPNFADMMEASGL
jgi:hypothetical protein